MSNIHVDVRSFPESITRLLSEVGFNKKDICVRVVEQVSLSQGGGDGRRSFVGFAMLDNSREPRVYYGSWGGANPFENSAVDCDNTLHNMISGSCVLIGYEGGGHPTHATLYIHPDNVAKMLPEKPSVSERDQLILRAFVSLTSAGRKNEWARYPNSRPSDEELDSLVSRGLLSRNKAGAMAITTAGKNSL